MNQQREPVFFLGGNDLEMEEIRKLLQQQNARVHDKQLGWGASIHDYRTELAAVLAESHTMPCIADVISG